MRRTRSPEQVATCDVFRNADWLMVTTVRVSIVAGRVARRCVQWFPGWYWSLEIGSRSEMRFSGEPARELQCFPAEDRTPAEPPLPARPQPSAWRRCRTR